MGADDSDVAPGAPNTLQPGRARTTTVFIDVHAHPQAHPYYLLAPEEPISPSGVLTLTRFVDLPAGVTGNVLLAMVAQHAKVGEDVMIVSHGNERGLAMPLVPHPWFAPGVVPPPGFVPPRLQDEVVRVLLSPAMKGQEAADVLFTTTALVADMRASIKAIAAKKLGRVELRACNVGDSNDALETFRDLFGAAEAGAPTIYDSYAEARPPMTGNVAAWAARHATSKIEQLTNGKVAHWAYGQDPRMAWEKFKFAWAVTDAKTEAEWTKLHFPAMTGGAPHSLHAFVMSDAGPFAASDAHWRFVFPGDAEFRSYLTNV